LTVPPFCAFTAASTARLSWMPARSAAASGSTAANSRSSLRLDACENNRLSNSICDVAEPFGLKFVWVLEEPINAPMQADISSLQVCASPSETLQAFLFELPGNSHSPRCRAWRQRRATSPGQDREE